MTAVMDGVRILEVAEHTFVPAASALLADWGAEVIKIEHVERGDAMRGLMSSGLAMLSTDVHVLLEHSNRGKKSLALDLTHATTGSTSSTSSPRRATSSSPTSCRSVRRKLKIDVDDIRAHNPNIIYVRGTGQGERGPDADAGSYDSLAYWCRAGIAMGMKQADDDVRADAARTGVRRLDRRHDHRRRDHGRAVPPRAHGRGDDGRRVAARHRPVVDGRGPRPVAPARRRLAAAARPAPRPATRSSRTYETKDGRFIVVLLPAGRPSTGPSSAQIVGRARARRPTSASPMPPPSARTPRRRPRCSREVFADAHRRRVARAPRRLLRPVGDGAGHARGRRRPADRGQRLRRRLRDGGRHAVQAGGRARAVRRASRATQPRARVQRARRRDPRRARSRLGHHRGPQGPRRRG